MNKTTMNDLIRMHYLGLQRLAMSNPKLASENAQKLASDIVVAATSKGLTYEEFQKAIVLADNSLYKKLSTNHTVK